MGTLCTLTRLNGGGARAMGQMEGGGWGGSSGPWCGRIWQNFGRIWPEFGRILVDFEVRV